MDSDEKAELERLRAWVARMEKLTDNLDPPDMLVHWHEDHAKLEAVLPVVTALKAIETTRLKWIRSNVDFYKDLVKVIDAELTRRGEQ